MALGAYQGVPLMRKIFGVLVLLAALEPSTAFGIVKRTAVPTTADQCLKSVTTTAANRAESDIQVRLIKNLLSDEEISSESYLAQVEKIRKKLGQ